MHGAKSSAALLQEDMLVGWSARPRHYCGLAFPNMMNRACGRITGGPEELLRLFLRLVLGPYGRTSCSRSRCPKGLGTFEWLLAKHLNLELFPSVLNLYVLNDYRRAPTAQRPRTTCTSTSGATSMTLPLAGTSPR
jgi:hypothetical protein